MASSPTFPATMRCYRAKSGVANRITRRAIKTAHAVQKIREAAGFKTLAGTECVMSVRRCCLCQQWFWGIRDRCLYGRQKEVGRLCPIHFRERYGKQRPKQFRLLSQHEIMRIENAYVAAGVTVYFVDPMSLKSRLLGGPAFLGKKPPAA